MNYLRACSDRHMKPLGPDKKGGAWHKEIRNRQLPEDSASRRCVRLDWRYQ